jgi:hypothetical protein
MTYINEEEYIESMARKGNTGEAVAVQDANTGKTYYLGFGQRADEHSLKDIVQSLRESGVEINLVKYPVYGIPHILKRDPVNNLKAYAVGKWLASRKHKKAKKQTKTKGKKTTKSGNATKQKSKRRARR